MCSCLMLLVFLTKLFSCTAQVKVLLQTNPVTYGEDVNLECSSLELHSVWHWFKHNVLLYRNHLPTPDLNIYKYEEMKIDDNHRRLTIHNFENADIARYSCTNGINGDFIDLSLKSDQFIHFDNSTNATVLQQQTIFGIRVTVTVSNVSPMPICHLEIENITFALNISRPLPQEAIASVIFQPTVFNVTFFCRQPKKTFYFVCDIGGLTLEENVKKKCSDFPKRRGSKQSSIMIEISSILSGCLLFISILVLYIYIWLRRLQSSYVLTNNKNPSIKSIQYSVTKEDTLVEKLEKETLM